MVEAEDATGFEASGARHFVVLDSDDEDDDDGQAEEELDDVSDIPVVDSDLAESPPGSCCRYSCRARGRRCSEEVFAQTQWELEEITGTTYEYGRSYETQGGDSITVTSDTLHGDHSSPGTEEVIEIDLEPEAGYLPLPPGICVDEGSRLPSPSTNRAKSQHAKKKKKKAQKQRVRRVLSRKEVSRLQAELRKTSEEEFPEDPPWELVDSSDEEIQDFACEPCNVDSPLLSEKCRCDECVTRPLLQASATTPTERKDPFFDDGRQ